MNGNTLDSYVRNWESKRAVAAFRWEAASLHSHNEGEIIARQYLFFNTHEEKLDKLKDMDFFEFRLQACRPQSGQRSQAIKIFGGDKLVYEHRVRFSVGADGDPTTFEEDCAVIGKLWADGCRQEAKIIYPDNYEASVVAFIRPHGELSSATLYEGEPGALNTLVYEQDSASSFDEIPNSSQDDGPQPAIVRLIRWHTRS